MTRCNTLFSCLRRRVGGPTGKHAAHQHIKQRDEKDRQCGGGKSAADNAGTDGDAAVGAGALDTASGSTPAVNASEVIRIGRRRMRAA
ncbi:hypothetical protein AK51_25050 [Serratia nematodiphila DZ0503SBS1]|nr:hypothetical protein AK51_25050 [Serratia nematodiphila DZ0503SBS1]